MALCALMVGCAPGGGKPAGGLDSGLSDSGGASDCEAPSVWYADVDGDGFGDAAAAVSACDVPEGTVEDATDCDDTRSSVFPGASEVCNDGLPNDCSDLDGSVAAEACPTDGPFSLTGADASLIGGEEGVAAGISVTGPGDVNGDGRGDLLVGAPYEGGGRAYLILSPGYGQRPLADADATFEGLRDADQAGWALTGVDDMDADGLPDLLIGVPEGPHGGQGGAYLFGGLVTGTLDMDRADASIQGQSGGDAAGTSLAGVGDRNGDGWGDILMGAPGYVVGSVQTGCAYLFAGPVTGSLSVAAANAQILGGEPGDVAGKTVANPGDLDGDGLTDLLIGAPAVYRGEEEEVGAAYVVLGPASGTLMLTDADSTIVGDAAFGHAGAALSGAGDVDGDGTPDILVGAPDSDGPDIVHQGRAFLVLGPALGSMGVDESAASFRGEPTGYNAGRSLAEAGDLNHDGFDDVVIGTLLSGSGDSYPGAAYVVMGPLTGTVNLGSVDMKFTGQGDEYAGWSVAGVGDTNLDGLPDLLIGIPGSDLGGTSSGAAALILGGGPAFTGTWGP